MKLVNLRAIFGFTAMIYIYVFFKVSRQSDLNKYRYSATRIGSRFTGHITNVPLPTFLRAPLFGAFGKAYGVNFDEIKEGNLRNFRTFNDFFTRELKDGSRYIENKQVKTSIVSPVDAKVLIFGEVDTE